MLTLGQQLGLLSFPGSLNRVPALIGLGRGGNVTSAGWQLTPCDPIWHVSSCSGQARCITTIHVYLYTENHKCNQSAHRRILCRHVWVNMKCSFVSKHTGIYNIDICWPMYIRSHSIQLQSHTTCLSDPVTSLYGCSIKTRSI